MASEAVSLSEGIKDITECCICTEIFKNPRILPCIHTFCYDCLEKTAEQFKWKCGEQVPCPLCRKEFILPVEGISAIPNNFYMERFLKMTDTSRPRDEKLCDPCHDNDDPPLARKYCIECQENLCENCATYHKKQKQLKNHQIVDIGNEITEEPRQKSAATYCIRHKDKSIEMFCNDCNEAICMKCFAASHQAHKLFEISNVAQKYREELRTYIHDINCDDGLKMKNQLLQVNEDFIEEVAKTEANINETASDLIDVVEKHRDTLLSKLNSIKSKTLKNYESQKDELDRQLTVLENFRSYCTEMECKGSDGDICRSIDDLREKFLKLKNMQISLSQQRIPVTMIKFKKTCLQKCVIKENYVGDVYELNPDTKEETAVAVRRKQAIHQNGLLRCSAEDQDWKEVAANIKAAAVQCLLGSLMYNSGSYIYTMYKDSNTLIASLHSSPFVISEEITIEQLETPRDMAFDATSNCLYITDSGNNSIWKIEIEERRVSCWLTGLGEPYALSVTKDCRVVIPREDHPSVIEVRTPDATLVRTVYLSEEIQRPIQSVETAESGFAIIYYGRDEEKIALCRVSESGAITRRFEPGDDAHEISHGCRILSATDKIVVIDYGNFEKSFLIDSEELAYDRQLMDVFMEIIDTSEVNDED